MTLFDNKPALFLSSLLVGTSLLLTACGPTAGGTAKARTQLSIQGTQPDGTVARRLARATTGGGVDISVYDSSGNLDGTLHLTTAWMAVKEINLEREDEGGGDSESGTDQEDEIEFAGPYVVDLLSSTTQPELPSLLLDAGHYDDIKLNIEKLNAEDVDANGDPLVDTYPELASNSLYLKGTYSDQNGSTYSNIPFELKYDQTHEFELATSTVTNSLDLSGDQTIDLIIAFRMARWFRLDDADTNDPGDNLATIQSAIDSDGSGGYQLILDGQSHSNIMAIIKGNIEQSADFGEDHDQDGELGSDEDEDDDDEHDVDG